MTYLIDTNVVSHAMARNKEPKVLKWYLDHEHECCLSCVTLGEIWKGIHLMPEGKRRTSLSNWAIRIERDFGEACLPLDVETLKVWGRLYARGERTQSWNCR
jgi:toxin FitB